MEITMADGGEENFTLTTPPAGSTGLFSQPPGRLEVKVAVEGYETLDGHLKLAESEANIYVLYSVLVEKKIKDEDQENTRSQDEARVAATSTKGFSLTAVSFCTEPKLLTLGGKEIRLEPGEPQLIPGWTGKGFEIDFEGEIVTRLGDSNEANPYLLIVHETDDQKLSFKHFLYELRE